MLRTLGDGVLTLSVPSLPPVVAGGVGEREEGEVGVGDLGDLGVAFGSGLLVVAAAAAGGGCFLAGFWVGVTLEEALLAGFRLILATCE